LQEKKNGDESDLICISRITEQLQALRLCTFARKFIYRTKAKRGQHSHNITSV
jgi:hypothetical protein